MSVTHLPRWDVTPIEIALDLEPPPLSLSHAVFSGPAEPRICLVAGFALTAQLKRILTAVDRVVPARLPAGLRVAPVTARASRHARSGAISIVPMLTLLRLQQRLIRAIEPGLADPSYFMDQTGELEGESAHFIHEFIPNKTLPTFEPALSTADITLPRLRPIGITIYRLGRAGVPQSILGHWAYAQSARGSIHLRSGP